MKRLAILDIFVNHGCSLFVPESQEFFVTNEKIIPEIGLEVRATVGDVIATHERVSAGRGAIASAPSGQSVRLIETISQNEIWYCDTPNISCFRDTKGDGKFYKYRIGAVSPPMNVIISHGLLNVPYTLCKYAVTAQNSFKMQLL